MGNSEHNPIKAKCHFEEIDSTDLIDSLNSLPLIKSKTFYIPTNMTITAPGVGVESLIEWSVNDILEAIGKEEIGVDYIRNTTNAVINARRALSCLVDWYLQRDGYYFCKNPPKNALEKSKILEERQIIDKLTSKVLQRIIDTRNEVEHDYKSISIEEAEDIVDLIRKTKDSLLLNSNPAQASIIFGEFKHKYSNNGHSTAPSYEFYGWENEVFIIALYDLDPWIGVLLPESIKSANIRFSYLKSTEIKTLTQIHHILNTNKRYYSDSSGLKYSPRWVGYQKSDIVHFAELAGIIK